MKHRGFILHETEDIAVIATLESKNVKTANMVQVWVLYQKESPLDAVRSGNDSVICGDCVHRGGFGRKRSCYVRLEHAPSAVWRAYKRGIYPRLQWQEYARVFSGRKVRWGAYGEPVLIPVWMIRAIAAVADGWTGYTHQWRKPEYQDYNNFVMASCDSERDAVDATAAGWRTFRVRTEAQALRSTEITCPASNEAGHKTTCAKCGLCNGRRGDSDPRKDIAIAVHGVGARHFGLIQIGGIA